MIPSEPPEATDADSPPQAIPDIVNANRETKRLLFLALGVVGIVALLHFTPLKRFMGDVQSWKEFIDQFGWRAHLGFIVASVAAIALGVPRLLLALVAGTLFGFGEGFAVAMLSSLCGSYAAFATARRTSPGALRQRIRGSEKLQRLLARPTLLSVFFVRQLPVPALLLNVLLGVIKTPHRTFLFGSFLGYLPSNAIVSAMGSAMGKEDATKALWQVTAGMIGLALVSLIIMAVRRRLDPDISGTNGEEKVGTKERI